MDNIKYDCPEQHILPSEFLYDLLILSEQLALDGFFAEADILTEAYDNLVCLERLCSTMECLILPAARSACDHTAADERTD